MALALYGPHCVCRPTENIQQLGLNIPNIVLYRNWFSLPLLYVVCQRGKYSPSLLFSLLVLDTLMQAIRIPPPTTMTRTMHPVDPLTAITPTSKSALCEEPGTDLPNSLVDVVLYSTVVLEVMLWESVITVTVMVYSVLGLISDSISSFTTQPVSLMATGW